MEKGKGASFNAGTEKDYTSSNNRAMLIICVIAVLILGLFCWGGYKENTVSKGFIDSLAQVKQENVALRKALVAKMESHCDTMTVDQKLAQRELDEYMGKMYEIKEAQRSKAYSQKEVASNKAYSAKENNNVGWVTYNKLRTKATLEMEKANPGIFAAYAVILFKDQKCYSDSYEFNRALYEKREKIEKQLVVAEYLKKINEANTIWSYSKAEVEKKYRSQLAEIEKNYQSQLVTIGENYQKKIAAKKAELGL